MTSEAFLARLGLAIARDDIVAKGGASFTFPIRSGDDA